MRTIKYFTAIIEDENGTLSIKRLMSVTGWILYLVLSYRYASTNTEFIIGTLCASVLGLVGITAYSNIKHIDVNKNKEE